MATQQDSGRTGLQPSAQGQKAERVNRVSCARGTVCVTRDLGGAGTDASCGQRNTPILQF